MAADLTSTFGFTDIRRKQGDAATPLATPAHYVDRPSLISALQGYDSGTYTTAYCAKLTKNDLVYALRLQEDAAGVK